NSDDDDGEILQYVFTSDEYETDEDETSSLEHLSEGEDELVDVRKKKVVPSTSIEDLFLTELIGSNIHLSLLFYVDDVIILSDWNQIDMENITRILNIFYIASGLKINFHKSNVFGVGVSNSEVVSMAACTGCEAGSFPFSYLGLPIGSNMSRIANWQILIDRFKARLSGWKANFFSIGGRLTLIKSVLGSLGGLGVGSLSAFNKALLLKWRWRLFNFSNSLWVQVIKAFHGNEAVPLNSIRFKVEDGSSIRFWKDTWLGNDPLYIRYNRLLHLENNKDYFISQRILNGSWEWDWCSPITMGRSKTEFDNLIIDISNMEIDDLVELDTCVWSLSNDDSFSVNSVRKHIDEHSLPSLNPCTR
nr:RNA-directed DNA polymerase, eukaryota, reverse transcriptase zinc-binding domain protein [Tanacetum cinerariifolium]